MSVAKTKPTEVLVDIASASSDRGGLNRLMTLIATDQVDMVLVTRFDRLSLSVTQLLQFVDLCRGKGVEINALEQSLLCQNQCSVVRLAGHFVLWLEGE